MIDASKWIEFKLIDIFLPPQRGKRLIETDRIAGIMPYYSASEKNNGLTDSIENHLFTRKDALIYTTFGDCFYVEGEFTASDEVSIFEHPKLNLYSGLFLATIIQKNKYKYAFGRKAFHNKYDDDTISIPAKKVEGKYEPDWQYMEFYMKSIARKVDFSDTILDSKDAKRADKRDVFISSEISKEKFSIGDEYIFDISLGHAVHSKSLHSGDISYVTRSAFNNGISGYGESEYINKGEAITVGAEGCKAFYQPDDFITGNKVTIIRYDGINKFNALFVCIVLNKVLKKYSYGYAATYGRLKNIEIELPIDSKGKPDWQFMEDYIKSLPYSSNLL